MSYEKKLMEMKKRLTKRPQTEKDVKEQLSVRPPSPHYEQHWLDAGLEKETNKYGIVYKKVIHYPNNFQHGSIHFHKLQSVLEKWKDHENEHPLASHKTYPLVFLDTETTGLKGAGTLVFLLGLLTQTPNGFTMTQYVLPNPDHEAAFLYASKLWEVEKCLVTYNGKSFDMPQIATRWTMNRQTIPALLEHEQIDLLHSSKRIWQDEVSRFRLVNMEEEKLGFSREGDIPGHLAPIIYQDAVKSGEVSALMKILKHNEWDVLSLVSLYIASSELILHDVATSATITTNIGKWYAYLKQYDQGGEFFSKVIDQYGENHPITHFHFAFIVKRKKQYDEAYRSFRIASEQLMGKNQIIAIEQVAKLYEHQYKQYKDALHMTNRAQVILANNYTLTKKFRERELLNFEKRKQRLQKKLYRS